MIELIALISLICVGCTFTFLLIVAKKLNQCVKSDSERLNSKLEVISSAALQLSNRIRFLNPLEEEMEFLVFELEEIAEGLNKIRDYADGEFYLT